MQENMIFEEQTKSSDASMKFEEILSLLKKMKLPLEVTLWSSQECADYLGISKKKFLNSVRADRSFPKPRNIADTERSHSHRWVAKEVINWAMSKKVVRI